MVATTTKKEITFFFDINMEFQDIKAELWNINVEHKFWKKSELRYKLSNYLLNFFYFVAETKNRIARYKPRIMTKTFFLDINMELQF